MITPLAFRKHSGFNFGRFEYGILHWNAEDLTNYARIYNTEFIIPKIRSWEVIDTQIMSLKNLFPRLQGLAIYRSTKLFFIDLRGYAYPE